MIDTVKLRIPVTKGALDRLRLLAPGDLRQGLRIEVGGEAHLCYEFHMMEWARPSSDRPIKVRLLEESHDLDFECSVQVEFSVPKFLLGHNVQMVYDWRLGLEVFRVTFMRDFGLWGSEVAPVDRWEVRRFDVCYSVRHEMCGAAMEYLRTVTLPRKEAVVYETSVMFKGSSYSLKWYLKFPELLAHDLKALGKLDEEKARAVVELARDVLRFEVTLRRVALQRHTERKTVLVGHLDDEFPLDKLAEYLRRWGVDMRTDVWQTEEAIRAVEEAYGSTNGKVGRLLGFMTLYQRVGEKRIRELMGKDAFNRHKREMEAAGVRVWDFSEESGIRDLSFFTQIPNEHAVNSEDVDWLLDLDQIRRLVHPEEYEHPCQLDVLDLLEDVG